MGKVAFVFSGQGDQYPGMGKALVEGYPAAAGVYEMCDRIRPGTSEQCFRGTQEELAQTGNTQPCLFAMELAAATVLMEKGIRPDAVAGFSLGEVVAATVAGYFDPETGFRLVCRRGELMQTEAQKHDTAMAAVVKLTAEQVAAIAEKYPDIYPVNFNCPGNVTVSGLASQMGAFSADVKASGGRALPLKVKGAFHSPFMKGAALLSQQIASPVRWEDLIRNMIGDGVDTFIEIGPGRTLTNMIKKIDDQVTAKPVTEFLEGSIC